MRASRRKAFVYNSMAIAEYKIVRDYAHINKGMILKVFVLTQRYVNN